METFNSVEREKVKMTGMCRFCGQTALVDVPEGAAQEYADVMATEECDCKEAHLERKRRNRLHEAGTWAESVFSGNQLSLMLCAIKTVFEGDVDSVTVRTEKYTHKIDVDAKGMLRIRTKYQDDGIVEF